MQMDRFELEFWLNPLDPLATYNLGSSCCKPVTVSEMLQLTGTDPADFYDEVGKTSLHYGYFAGMPRLKEAIAGLFTDVVTPRMVTTVHGGTGANSIVCYTLCEPGDNVVVVVPSYQQFVSIPKALGCGVRSYVCDEADGYGIDMDKMASLVDERTKAIFLTNPSNPTGYALGGQELEGLAKIARRVGAYVVSDEIYRGMLDGYTPSICDVYERGISTGGMSKVFSAAGTRVGWIVTRDEGLTERIMNFRSYNSICEGPLNELIAATILEHKEVFYERNGRICREGRAALEEWMADKGHLRLACKSAGSTSLVLYDYDIPAQKLADDLFDQRSTLVCHGGCFGVDNAFRIGYGFGDVDYFKAGLAQIAAYLEDLEK